jgi:uncharacterized protein (TIGR02466 family)
MTDIVELFVTPLYRAEIESTQKCAALAHVCHVLSADDVAGQRWSAKNKYLGYTSYASLNDLPMRFPEIAALVKKLDRHVAEFAKRLAFDLGGKKLVLDALWVNILEPGGTHSGHIHPHSVISGTFYVALPDAKQAIKFEDPRLGLMMAAPPRKKAAPQNLQTFVYVEPRVGEVLVWESWLRHEVVQNLSDDVRISISFNYRWG